jgi:type VI secretion system secreted protein VgrG
MAHSRITVGLSCDDLPEGYRVLVAKGKESFNQLSRWQVTIGFNIPQVVLEEDLIGKPVSLLLVDADEPAARTVGLVLVAFQHEEERMNESVYTLFLAPGPILLTYRSGFRVFQEKTTKEIVTEVLRDAGIPDDQVIWRVTGSYPKRNYCVQYGEKEWAFVERLLADEGISYWFDTEDGEKPVMILSDNPDKYDDIDGLKELTFQDGMAAGTGHHFFEFERTERVTVEAVYLRDYDVRAPDVFIEGEAGDGALEYYEFPAGVPTSDAAKTRAQARLEQLQRYKVDAKFASHCVRSSPGRLVDLTNCADDDLNGEYLIIEVEHTYERDGSHGGDGYSNEVRLVPHEDMAFRPDLPKIAPKIHGLESATTTGASGEEIHVDDIARVKLRFPWDRSGVADDKSSCWVRTMQMNMDGSMVLPRVSWEVPVVYLDGNPDVPVVLGRFFNAAQVVPYGLPGAAATTALQSGTSPGDGTTNEIRLADDGGKQEFFVHASKDQTVFVGGSATSDVMVNETHDVTKALIATVKSSQTHTVGATQSVNVGTDYSIGVGGSRTETVGAMEAIKVTANRTVVVKGAYTELIGGVYGIQCNQENTNVVGAFTNVIAGGLGMSGALGIGDTVVAARTELNGATKTTKSRGDVGIEVTGILGLTAGLTKEKADGNIATNTKALANISATGSGKLKASGAFVIHASSVKIEAADMIAGAFKLKGGKMTVSKGTTKFKGKVKRKGDSKLEA